MPELPEVETIARGLASRVSGDVIESVWLGQKPEPLKSPAREMAAALEHSRIATVRRVGKHIVFDLDRVERTLFPAKSRDPKTLRRGSKGRLAQSAPSPHADTAQWIVHLGMTGRLRVC